MKNRKLNSIEFIIILAIFLMILAVFFYKVFIFKLIPFPGDLLVAEYQPWKSYSYLGYNPGSVPNKAQYFDTLRQLYPWKTFSIELLKNKEVPLWNPYNFAGAPLLANFQSAIFYPLNLFYLSLPQISAWTILIMLQPFLAIFFTYFYCKKIKLSKFACAFSSVSFGFSHFLIVWLEYNTIGQVIFWLPLVLLAVENLVRKISVRWQIIFIAGLLFSFLAGHIQVFFYELVFVLVYALFRGKSKLGYLKTLGLLGSLTAVVLGIGAAQLIPGFELIGQSARSVIPYKFLVEKILIQPWQLVMLVVADFFGNPATRNYWPQDTYVGKVISIGIVPLFFIIASILSKKRSTLINFYLTSSIIILLLVSANPLSKLIYKIGLPFFSSSSPTLMTYLLAFSLSILAGIGVDQSAPFASYRHAASTAAIWQRCSKKLIPIIVMIVIFSALWIVTFKVSHADVARRNLLYSSIVFGVSLPLFLLLSFKKKIAKFAFFILLLLHIGDRFYTFAKFNPFVPKDFVFPKTDVVELLRREAGINRFWGYGSARLEANFATQERLFSPDGYDPLYPKRYGEFIRGSKNGKVARKFNIQTRSDAFIAPGFGEDDLVRNLYRLRVLDLLGVKYILDKVENASTQKTFPQERFKLIYNQDGWRVFKNIKALPRAFLVYDYKVFNSKREFEEIFFDADFNSRQTILLEEKPNFNNLTIEQFNNETIINNTKVTKYTPNVVEIEVQTKNPGLLFISDTYYPGWKVYVDGKTEKILRANYAFRAVPVTKGNHNVVFSYEPDSFTIGSQISILSFVFILPVTVFLRRYV